MVRVEIVYILEDKTIIQAKCLLEDGATVGVALQNAGLLEKYPEIDSLPLGVFSVRATKDTVLANGDRIEVYRPLKLDPKEKRKLRAKKG